MSEKELRFEIEKVAIINDANKILEDIDEKEKSNVPEMLINSSIKKAVSIPKTTEAQKAVMKRKPYAGFDSKGIYNA